MTYGRKHEKITRPVEGRRGVIIFIALVISGIAILFTCCSVRLDISSYNAILVLDIFITILAVGWCTFTWAKADSNLLDILYNIGIVCGSLVIMFLVRIDMVFWITFAILIYWSYILILRVTEDIQPSWKRILSIIYAEWVFVGFVVTLGSPSLLSYATPVIKLSEIYSLLDLRYLLTICVILAASGDAMVKALSSELPDIVDLPDLRFSIPSKDAYSNELFITILTPLIVILNSFILVFQKLTNIVWHLLVMILIYVYRTGVNLANHLIDLFTNGRIWLQIAKILSTIIMVIIFAIATKGISPFVYKYLTSESSLSLISADIIFTLLKIFGFFLMTLIGIILLSALWSIHTNLLTEHYLSQCAFGGSMILISLSLSAGVVYFISKFKILYILGFNYIGVYSLLILFIVGGVFIFQVIKRLSSA